ncbi:hypothetical protein HPP92_000470 [Vanilla planifolia]|uniref:Uncharacterized protein n=1 Tax=Vanilla planifolia TaxID=51239 RepID=A0A835S0N8_VANPL|nr:hypothetical protein HPP92_000470 [Vanilla planifolia]
MQLLRDPLPLRCRLVLPRLPSSFNLHSILFFTRAQTVRCFSSSFRRQLDALPSTERELLQGLLDLCGYSKGDTIRHLPAVRSYEADLACLTLIGAVGLDQALIAAAADGGETAEEHLASGASTMVVETVFPGGSDEHSTISTRLFLPSEMVKEKARKLRRSSNGSMPYNMDKVSKNILAVTFRQVVLKQMSSFQLSLFCPGTERNMEELDNPREVQSSFVLNSSDEKLICSLAEVVSSFIIRSSVQGQARRSPYDGIFHLFCKPRGPIHSPISICQIAQSEFEKEARNHIETYKFLKPKSVNMVKNPKECWWLPFDYSRLDVIGGSGFGTWACEFIPIYKLQMDTSKFRDVKLEGWFKQPKNRCEALLTHFQMVDLVNILDMYYEDRYTIPSKSFSCDMLKETPVLIKRKQTPWKLMFAILAGGCVVLLIGVLAQLFQSKHARKDLELQNIHSSLELLHSHLNFYLSSELENLCFATIKMVKDELGWTGDVIVDRNTGVWIGTLPSYLRNGRLMVDASSGEKPLNGCVSSQSHVELSNLEDASSGANEELQERAQDIASYQAVLTAEGKLIGFQPTSRVAVNHWASNPLAKALYGTQKHSPGLFEPRLSIPRPTNAIPIELLMSVNPKNQFALARPME